MVQDVTRLWADLYNPANAGHTHEIYGRMREVGAFVPIRTGDLFTTWAVTRYDEAVDMLKDTAFLVKDIRNLPDELNRRFSSDEDPSAEMFSRMMLLVDPPDHTRLRGLVHKAFTPRIIENLRPRIQEICDTLLDRIQEKGTFDLIEDYALPVPITVIAEMLGVPHEDQANFRRWSQIIIAQELGEAMQMAAFEFIVYMNNLIDERRENPREDLLSGLVHVREEGDALTHPELLGMIFLLLVAGHETTVNLIGNGTLALLENPDQLAKLHENPALIRPAIEEMLRYNGPVEMATNRWTKAPFEVDNGTIQPGDLVSVSLHSANRDPRKFNNPDTFDITRDPNPHIAFGSGIHYCLGAPLARLEGMLAVQTLITRLPKLQLAQDPTTIQWSDSLLIHGMRGLQLTV